MSNWPSDLPAAKRQIADLYDLGMREYVAYLQAGLVPLRHGTGIVRLPVFWEDDSHWDLTGGEWSVADHLEATGAGGVRALAAELAEDAASTKIVRAAGLRVRLVDNPFQQPLGRRTLKEVWRRQTRWARLRRAGR